MGSDYVGVSNKIRPGISGAYGISKSALRVAVEYFRHEYKSKALIGYLNPGTTDTAMFHTMKTALLSQQGIFNIGKPASPAHVATFIRDVLLYSSAAVYSKTDWDYRNDKHHELTRTASSLAPDPIRSSL